MSLSMNDLQKLVTEAFCNNGGLELAKTLLQGPPEEPGPSNNNELPWCICNKCHAMPTADENVCCHKRPCVSIMGWFETVVLNRDGLSVAIEARSDIYADDPEYNPASYRKAAYWQFILWQHGHLGRGNRRVVPSCVVWSIRSKYPAPDGGFREY